MEMRKNSVLKIIGLGILLSFFLSAGRTFLPLSKAETGNATTEKIRIVATTSLIENIVEKIGKDKVAITTIVPAGMCPGHFDVKSEEIKEIRNARVVIIHGWEKWIEKLIKSTKNNLPIRTVKIEENWMLPDVQIRAAKEITKILSEINPRKREWYEKNLIAYEKEIQSLIKKIEKVKKDSSNVKVICASQQEEFLKWLGFKVVAAYGRPEELTPREIIGIIKKAKSENVAMVVDNLQSGADAGLLIAREIGISHIMLTNFPLGGSYLDSLKDNINKIGQILEWQKL